MSPRTVKADAKSMPPKRPWMIRKMISWFISWATPHRAEAATNPTMPAIVWSSAASKSANITPMVASTLIRVVSSACGMGFSLLDAHRLDEAQTQMTQLNELRVGQTPGQRHLRTCGLPPERLDALAALIGELGVDRAPVDRVVDPFDQAVTL